MPDGSFFREKAQRCRELAEIAIRPEVSERSHKFNRPLSRKAEGARLESDAIRPLLMARTPRGA
jgi:hypothetical protein